MGGGGGTQEVLESEVAQASEGHQGPAAAHVTSENTADPSSQENLPLWTYWGEDAARSGPGTVLGFFLRFFSFMSRP